MENRDTGMFILMDRHLIFYIILTILTIIILAVISSTVKRIINKNKDNHTKEGFVETTPSPLSVNDPVNLDKPTSFIFREKNAIQSCESLRTTDPSMSNKSQDTMNLVLDSHRINEWKPGPDDPLRKKLQDKSDRTYCYMYNDKENKMKDMRLFNDPGCSLQNPIFDAPFIENVYKTKYPDNTHTIPIEKCVIEIDPSKTSTSNLDAYWEKWGDTKCGSVTDPLRSTLADKVKVLDVLEEKMAEATKILDDYMIRIDQVDLDITSCNLSKTRNAEMFKELQDKYKDIYSAFLELDVENRELIEVKTDKIKEENEKLAYVREQEDLFLEIEKKNDGCQLELQKCNRERDDVEESLRLQIEKRIENERTRDEKQVKKDEIKNDHDALIVPVAECDSALESGRNELHETIENIDTTRGLYNTCDVERLYNKNLMEIYEPKYVEMEALAEECLARKEQLFRDNEACSEQKRTCAFLKDEHTNTVMRFRAIRDKLLECEERRKEHNVVRRELEEQNVYHFNELDRKYGQIDEIERALYKDEIQSSISHSENVINKFRSDLDILMNANIENSGCSAKAEYVRDLNKIRNRNAELKYRVESLKSQSCYYCDPSVSHCAEKFKNDSTLCSR